MPRLRKPLAYLLEVMNDPNADDARRDRLALEALPYCHARKDGKAAGGSGKAAGKKELQSAAAKTAGRGSAWGDDLEYDTPPN